MSGPGNAPNTRGRGSTHRGRGRRGRNFGGQLTNGNAPKPHQSNSLAPRTQEKADTEAVANVEEKGKGAEDGGKDEDDLCFICAEPIKFYALGPCSHRTCHVCAIRLRALYKKTECTFCKDPIDRVIFTSDPSSPYQSFNPANLPFSDVKLGISFETQEMLDETLSLLRFNCPDDQCGDICHGWVDLKRHVRQKHGKMMCELCTRNKKIFAHEHTLFTAQQLSSHNRIGDSPSNSQGFRGHPPCEFCQIDFYDNDALFAHCRDMHEQCFICVKNGTGTWKYFLDYNMLEEHFREEHHPCPNPDCRDKKFVVFENELDLKGHILDVHGIGDKKEMKDLRRVEVAFTYGREGEASGSGNGASGSGTGGRRGRGRADRREEIQVPAEPLGREGRHVPGLGNRQKSFRGNLSQENPEASTGNSADPLAGDVLEQHGAFLRRFSEITGNSETKLSAFKSAVRSFRNSEIPASDLVDTVFNLLDRQHEAAESTIFGLADLLDNDEKRVDVRNAWREFRNVHYSFPALPGSSSAGPVPPPSSSAQRTDFPALTAIAPVANGQPANVASLRNMSLPRYSRSGAQSSVLARVEQAAKSSRAVPGMSGFKSNFPSLSGTSTPIPSTSKAPIWKTTPVNAVPTSLPSSSRPQPTREPHVTPASGKGPQFSLKTKDAFPSLPSSNNDRQARLKAALGPPDADITTPFPPDKPSGLSSWGASTAKATPRDPPPLPQPPPPGTQEKDGGGGKKGKKKQVLLYHRGL
ncbi:hypothetical protein BT69DRAFT_1236398 [Atractiella rhizophila]|nr:hypothetical protein BT69DRAFT_1236398 [Atractiella rhizophila]